ncbi:MAG: hypothetical protein R2727_11565 [Bacteroidales bacterium]
MSLEKVMFPIRKDNFVMKENSGISAATASRRRASRKTSRPGCSGTGRDTISVTILTSITRPTVPLSR